MPATTTKASSGYVPSGGGGSSRGGGGGGGGGKGGIPANNLSNIVPPEVGGAGGGGPVSNVNARSNDISVNTVNDNTVTWEADTATNKWKLNVSAAGGGNSLATTGFYVISRKINDTLTVANTYYIDASGNMLTGWLNTSDGKWYYFDNAKNGNEGNMAIGWKQIGNDWYYFTGNGTMLADGITPDGFKIGKDGKFIQ